MKIASLIIIITFFTIDIFFTINIIKTVVLNKTVNSKKFVCEKSYVKWISIGLSIVFNAVFFVIVLLENTDLFFLLMIIIVNLSLCVVLLFTIKQKIIMRENDLEIVYAFKKTKVINFSIISKVTVKNFDMYRLTKRIIAYDLENKKLFSFLSTHQNSNILINKLKHIIPIPQSTE